MTTRQSTRRELQDLAKLAATMPMEPPPKPARPDLERPPTPSTSSASFSRMTVPPSVASVPPAALAAAATGAKKRSGAVVAVLATLGVAVAVAGGVQIGKYFAHRGPATASAANAPIVVTPPGALATPPPAVAPADPPPVAAAAAPPAGTAAPVAAATTAPVAASKAPALPQAHRWQPPASKPAAMKTSSLTANIPASTTTMDPLEAAIRKAVAQGPQK